MDRHWSGMDQKLVGHKRVEITMPRRLHPLVVISGEDLVHDQFLVIALMFEVIW